MQEPGAPDSVIARMRGPSKRLLVALGVGGLLVVIGIVAILLTGRSTEGAAKAYGDFWGCIAGEPLEDGERAEMRMRSVAAALGEKKLGWPDDCQRSLDAFYESIPSDPKSEAIRQLMDVELDCKRKCDTSKIVVTLQQIDSLAEAAKIRPKGPSKSDPPARLEGLPLQDRDFPELVPGTVTFRGVTSLGPSRRALLYRDASGALALCEVDTAGESPARCGAVAAKILPQSARFVEGKTVPTVHGIVKMAETPEDTEYGAFDAWTGEPIADDLGTLVLASDRARFQAPSRVWADADLGGVKATLTRTESGVLMLERGGRRSFVMDDAEHGGPASGDPFAVSSPAGIVVFFQGKKGLSALFVPREGRPRPVTTK
ncbi:MAG: hypothetical protein JNK04_10460 [Myxococcales bacterium]|nr:hypothetical protein [Myxococcales bacterium]